MNQLEIHKTLQQRIHQASQLSGYAHPFAGGKAPSPPPSSLPSHAYSWLHNAALQFDASSTDAIAFAQQGMLTLDALTVVLLCLREEPVPLWIMMGYLRTPREIHPDAWQEALLRANDIAMAMNGSSFGLDEQGNTFLMKPLAFDIVDDVDALALSMNDANTLASCLIDSLLSLGQPSPLNADENNADPAPLPEPDQRRQSLLLHQEIDLRSAAAIQKQWHIPLMLAACKTLGSVVSLSPQESCVSVLSFPERKIIVIADGDERHLLVSTPMTSFPHPGYTPRHLLLANNNLMALAHCSFSLSSSGTSLLARWDTYGLDGSDFASWLADFMTLATACEIPTQPITPEIKNE